MAAKTDLRKSLESYRARQGELRLVDVPDLTYLVLDGRGDPSDPGFAESVESLYPVAYAMKAASRRELDRDYVVPPLEGLWWADDMDAFTVARDRAQWRWRLMLLVPDWLDEAAYDAAVAAVRSKGRSPRLEDVRCETLSEGSCLQTLHVGSFEAEAEVVQRIHDHAASQGLRLGGRHHEIYLSHFRRVPPERRRTIVRQPVVSEGGEDDLSGS